MDSLEFDGQTYISTKRAAEITGYAKDYVGQLCREGRVTARFVGRSWYVSESSIKEHRFGTEEVVEEEVTTAPEAEEVIEEPEEEIEEEVVEEKKIETAQYVAEEVTPLPSLEDEKETSEEATTVESAWKEWFDTRKPTVKEEADEVAAPVIQDITPSPIKIEKVEKPEVRKVVPKVKASRQGSLSRSTASAILIGLMLITISATLLITGSIEKYVEKAPISGTLMYLGGTSFIK